MRSYLNVESMWEKEEISLFVFLCHATVLFNTDSTKDSQGEAEGGGG